MILRIMSSDQQFLTVNNPPPTYQTFILPEINFGAKHFSQLISLEPDGKFGHTYYYPAKGLYRSEVSRKKVRVTVPPLLRGYTTEQISGFLEKPLRTDYWCHSQPCERMVKNTTEAVTGGKMSYELQLGQAILADISRQGGD